MSGIYVLSVAASTRCTDFYPNGWNHDGPDGNAPMILTQVRAAVAGTLSKQTPPISTTGTLSGTLQGPGTLTVTLTYSNGGAPIGRISLSGTGAGTISSTGSIDGALDGDWTYNDPLGSLPPRTCHAPDHHFTLTRLVVP